MFLSNSPIKKVQHLFLELLGSDCKNMSKIFPSGEFNGDFTFLCFFFGGRGVDFHLFFFSMVLGPDGSLEQLRRQFGDSKTRLETTGRKTCQVSSDPFLLSKRQLFRGFCC